MTTNLFSQGSILFKELHDAVCQLRVVQAEALWLVHGNEDASQEQLVFFLERQRKSVDDGAEYFQQLGNAIETLCLVYELEENIVD